MIALDGNPVPNPRAVPVLVLAPAERIDAIVEMKQPGVWVFGSTEDSMREMGMGVVIEYADQRGAPQWSKPPVEHLGLHRLWSERGDILNRITVSTSYLKKFPAVTAGLIVGRSTASPGRMSDPLVVKAGRRYRIVMENKSGDDHPIHLHRHTFEITRIGGKTTSGIRKDTVNVPRRQSAEIDFVADDPGLTLFHCHMQLHMDFGFMALMKYA